MYQSEDGKDQAELDEVSSGCSMAGVHLPCPAESLVKSWSDFRRNLPWTFQRQP